jgi:signal transduction histidine kinase
MTARVIIGVCLAWVFLGLVWGAQTTMGAILRGADPVPLGGAIRMSFTQMLPWIPVTLAAIALTRRCPLTRAQWKRHLVAHIAAVPILAFVANVLVVLGYWMTAGMFNGIKALLQQGLLWGAVNFHVALLIYATVVAITQGVLYYQRTRAHELQLAKIEGQLARARLQALNAQIRPHFLFNTLHTIGQLWRSGRSDDADAVLDQLGSLFSRVQSSTSKLEVPLAEELELVEAYLAIEEARFRDRLRTTVNASPGSLDCLVPPLILQPLVENAIRHGVSAVSSAGRVGVSAALENGHLRLVVTDDGPGMAARTAQPGSGTGLRNTRERLAQLYGANAELRIDSPPDGGTRVTVEIPAAKGSRDNGNGFR